MKCFEFVYKYGDKEFQVNVVLKRQRNIYYRFKNGKFLITAPYFTTKKMVEIGLNKFAEKLIKRDKTFNSNFSLEEDYIFLLGEKVQLSTFNLKNIQEIDGLLRKKCQEIIIPLVRKYEGIMGVFEPYKVSFRHTKNQFGSNSKKTHHLSFQIELIHYSQEIIETVVVHELAHEFERNHSQNFYNIVYKYCPNYREIQRKLKKGIHK